jgi:type II secretion system protein J
MNTGPRVRARGGFTLVEVLVTVLIISGMMVAVTQILNAARISRDTIHNVQETQLAGPAIMDLVERDLRGLVAYDMEPNAILRVKNRVVMGLDADSLDFIGTTDDLAAWEVGHRYVRADVNEIGYRLRPNPNEKDLLEIYRRESFGIDDQPFEGGQFTFLHDRVKHFDVALYTEDGPDAEPSEEWDGSSNDEQIGLPARLEISLTLELAPRILREQLAIAPVDKRTVTYRRVIRLPQSLRDSLEAPPMPAVPEITKSSGSAGGTGGAGGKDANKKPSGGAPSSSVSGGNTGGSTKNR